MVSPPSSDGDGEDGRIVQSRQQRKAPRWRASSRRSCRIDTKKILFALATIASFMAIVSIASLHQSRTIRDGFIVYKNGLDVKPTDQVVTTTTWHNPLSSVLMWWVRRIGNAVEGEGSEQSNSTETMTVEAAERLCDDDFSAVGPECSRDPSPELLRQANAMLSISSRAAVAKLLGRWSTRRRVEIFLVVLTKSAPENVARRNTTRGGWLLQARQRSTHCQCSKSLLACQACSVKVGKSDAQTWLHHFVVGGRNLKRGRWSELSSELVAFNDLLFYPDEDAYMRLTWKVMWSMDWMLDSYNFRYLLLLDDDCFVDMRLVMDYIRVAPRERLYAGRVAYKKPKVQRDHHSKWFVNSSVYSHTFYPPYPWGAGLFLSHDVVVKTLDMANAWQKHSDWFGIDDAFMGILMNDSGITPTNIDTIHPDMWQFKRCNHRKLKAQPMIITAINAKHMTTILKLARENRSLCPVLIRPASPRKRRLHKVGPIVIFNLAVALVIVVAVMVVVSMVSDGSAASEDQKRKKVTRQSLASVTVSKKGAQR